MHPHTCAKMSYHITYFAHRPIHQLLVEAFQRYLDEDFSLMDQDNYSPRNANLLDWVRSGFAARRRIMRQISLEDRMFHTENYIVITTQEVCKFYKLIYACM